MHVTQPAQDLPTSPTSPPTSPSLPERVVPMFRSVLSGSSARALRVAMIGSFSPRKCGIATFTSDIQSQLGTFHPEIGLDIYAINDPRSALEYRGVAQVISSGSEEDYRLAARRINESGVDAVWLQHEYGLYGGAEGDMVCEFVDRIAPPLVLTLHTVLTDPSCQQRRILEHLVSRASRIMVMSCEARTILCRNYAVPAEVIEVIPHGAPDRPFGREAGFKRRLGLEGRNVLMTFGLLGPGKGLERVIEALPAIVARHPATVYRIVGATHPNLVASEGESYRESLKALSRTLGVEDHVLWENRFLDTNELLDQLEACDIYLTPYANLQQSTSGTLSYAVALGKAVVSTPYVHARELLADGVGVLIEPGCAETVAKAVCGLLDDRAELAAVKHRAYAKGRTTIWPEFARAAADLVRPAVSPRYREVPVTASPGLSGVFAMSDGTGMLQHSIVVVPDRRHGYCLDDNVRALMLMGVADTVPLAERQRWAMVYASFIQHAWNPDARAFRNFMNFDRTWCEPIGSADSNGRTVWALGRAMNDAPDEGLRHWAAQWFDIALAPVGTMDAPRTVAFVMLGCIEALRANPAHGEALASLRHGAELLANLLNEARRPDWAWFEAVLSYDNPRLSQALIGAGQVLERADWMEAGLSSLRFIARQQGPQWMQRLRRGGRRATRDGLPMRQLPIAGSWAPTTALWCWPTSPAGAAATV